MKRLLPVIAILCVTAMILCMTGCGESKKPEATTPATEAATPETTEAPAEDETTETPSEEVTDAQTEEATDAPAEDTAEAGSLVPSIIIEYGDYDGIVALSQDAVNMKIAEGTVVQISGISFKGGNDVSIMEDSGEGVRKGLVMHIEGDWEAPKDYTDIDVIGTFKKGTYVMELHVLPENITIKE